MTISDDNGPLSGTGVADFSSSHVYELCSCHSKLDLAASNARFHSVLSGSFPWPLTLQKWDDVCTQAGEVGSE